ncbi:MAG: FAD-dependent oxidoreductase [Victivallales bacterium]
MKYVIIGGSAAGISAAKTIREKDAAGEITVVCRDEFIYSRCQLHLVAAGASTAERIRLSTPDWAGRSGISLLGGREVVKLDPGIHQISFSDGWKAPYDRLLIATGSRTIFPPIGGVRGPMTYGLRDIDDAVAINRARSSVRNIVVIGAGLIGIELAAELARSGLKVSVVEIADRPLPLQLESICGSKCAKILSDAGVDLHFLDPARMVHRSSDGTPICVELVSGRKVPCELLVCAAGVKTNSEFAAEAGVKTGRGICIDSHCRTSLPDIFAAGDVTEFVDSVSGVSQTTAIWPTAVRQGKIAGANMVGENASLNINTGMKAAISLLGTHAVSLGPVTSPDRQWHKHVFIGTDSQGRENCKILYADGNILKAALLWGDVTNAGLYHEAIVNRRDISADLECLGSFDAAKRGKETLNVL